MTWRGFRCPFLPTRASLCAPHTAWRNNSIWTSAGRRISRGTRRRLLTASIPFDGSAGRLAPFRVLSRCRNLVSRLFRGLFCSTVRGVRVPLAPEGKQRRLLLNPPKRRADVQLRLHCRSRRRRGARLAADCHGFGTLSAL